MKQFLRYTLTLVAILIATTNAWADATCHTVTKSTFTTDATYTKKSWGITTTYYYYSQPQQQFLQITDNEYSILSSVTFTVTGDQESGEQKFKILYNTGSGWQYYSTTEYSLKRGGMLQGYPADSETITLSDAKIKSATAFGIEFTNYNSNSNGNRSASRTINITDVKVNFAQHFTSEADGTILEFEPTQVNTPCATTYTIDYEYNNTVTSCTWKSNNPMFQVEAETHTQDCSGTKQVVISFTPTKIRDEITGTITGTDNNGNVITIYVKGSSWGYEAPSYEWNTTVWNGTQARTIYVGETINNMITNTSSPADCNYTITLIEESGINNGDAKCEFKDNTFYAGKAGKFLLTVTQPEAISPDGSGYTAGETQITLEVLKRTTSFFLNTLSECYTGDEFALSELFNTTTNNTEVPFTCTSGHESILKFENNKLIAVCAGETTFTVEQKENYKWLRHAQTLNITVKKHDSGFQLRQTEHTCKIGDVITEAQLYTLVNNEILPTIESNNPEVVSFNPTTRQLEAKKAGEAIITISQPADCKWTDYTTTCKVIVEKHTPIFTWEDPVYFNSTVIDYFSTNNTATAITITQPSTDTDVAELYFSKTNATDLHTLDLTTYAKESSTTVTISQEENWYWYAKTETHTITPIDPNNHVTFTIDSQERRDVFDINWETPKYDWSDGIQLGDWTDGFNYKDKYVELHFTGIPDKLGFSTSIKNATNLFDVSGVYWYVKESTNGTNWSDEIWNQEDTKKITITGDSIQLDPDTRYIRLCYSGNFGGVFHNITVTELNQFEAVPNVLDFGLQYVDNPKTTKSFDFKYANAGYKVHLESTDTMFTVATTYIDTIGGEKYGTVHDIQVTYNPLHVHQTTGKDAMILIWDEAGHRDTVFLHVNTVKSKPSLYWTEDWSATEPIVLLGQHMPDTVAKATNGYPVKYRSDDESILKIADDSLSFIAVGIGETYITAHADSDRVYLQPDTIRKLFRVTDKLVQRIVWEDNLTDFCIDDGQDTLRAQVWVLTDAANGTWEYSPEQTAELKYSSTNVNIATVADSILTIHGTGEMFLQATVPADDFYEMASAQIPVRVRDCSVQCTDADLVIPIVGMQLEDELHFNPYQTWDNEKIVEIDTSKGIPGNLTFTYRGVKEWTVLEGKIRVFESTDGGNTWNQVLSDADAVTPEDNTTQYSPLIPLSPNATHIKFERFPNAFSSVKYGSHYVQFITVLPAHYIKTVPDDIHFGNVYVGNSIDTTINVLYSSIRSDLQLAVSENHLTIDKTTIEDECGAWDTIPLTISLKADISIMGNYRRYITVTDPIGGMTDTIHVYANIVKNSPTITWNPTDTIRSSAEWETQKTAISSSGDPVLYEITEGNQLDEFAYLNDAGKMILLRGGRITARAYTEETTTSNEVSAYHNFYIIVDPLFEDFSNDGNWLNDNNWNIGRIPWTTDSATIAANKHVSLDTEIITEGLSFESGSSIHITHTGGLTINEAGVTNAAADGSSIIIDNKPQGAGFLRISPSALEANKHPYFTMNFTTRAFNEGVPRDETWQYMGAPGNNATFTDLNSQTLIYHWDETKGWTPYTVTDTIPTWQGYALTQSKQANHTYHITAQAIQGTKTIDLTYTASGMKGDNLFVNSFTAPIDIATFEEKDFKGNWVKTFYFFNTGSWNDWQGTNHHTHDESSAGHYYAVPLFIAEDLVGSQTIVPPMQGVYVQTDNADSITLDYTKHVWNGAAGNLPMRAPQKQSPDFRRVRIQVSSDNSGADRMYIIQKPSTTRDYDNGYDGKNINAKGQVNIYTNEPFGKMEVSCANNIDSMYIGLRTGSDTHYTLTFGAVAGDSLYLQDLENDSIIPIFDDEQYHFTAEPNAVNNNRFLLLSRPYKAPNSETSTPETDGDELTKIWSVGKVIYIANAPANSVATLYTVSGHLVLSTPIANTQSPTILDVSYLPEGVYILRLNDQVYKFVCK